MNKFDIADEWCEGYLAAMRPSPIDQSKSDHYQAGYLSGYKDRKIKNAHLNEYLKSIGSDPMFDVVLC